MKTLHQSTPFTTVEQARADKQWVVIDAEGLVVGRLASIVALRLRGKHKSTFTPHADDGDRIIIVNAEKVLFTGRKRDQKIYTHYTGFQGGLKERTARFILDSRFPERVLEKAVERMLPRGPLGRRQLANLRVYKGAYHPHEAQQPIVLDIASMNPKNTRSPPGTAATTVDTVWHSETAARPEFPKISNVSGKAYRDIFRLYKEARFRKELFDKLDNGGFSDTVRNMTVDEINGEIQRLVLQLDSGDAERVRDSLTRLSIILPRLDLDKCLKDFELRKTLRSVPDRLFAALSDNLDVSGAAKTAAFALVAAMYPEHYRLELTADEKVARSDLEDIFDKNNVHSFLTIKAEPDGKGAKVDARLWNEMPFELAGAKPALAPSDLIRKTKTLKIAVSGARAVHVEPIPGEDLQDGQLAGIRARLEPQPETASFEKVIMDFKNDEAVHSREVFDFNALFPIPATK